MGKNKKWSRKNSDIIIEYEKGSVIKTQKELINIALVYPNTYQTGMSNLGFQSVYGLFNDNDRILCHRYFMPPDRCKDSSLKFKHDKTAHLDKDKTYRHRRNDDNFFEPRSCETGIPLSSCDVIAFSVSFENDYINVVSILRNSGIPPRTSDRNSSHALIIAGGVACFLNPEPLTPFIDCFLLGEAEEMLPAFLDIFLSICINSNLDINIALNNSNILLDTDVDSDRYPPPSDRHPISHEHLKKQLATKLKGAYVPEFYQPSYDIDGNFAGISPLYDDIPAKIAVQHIKSLDNIVTTTHILTTDTIFNNTFLIETGRGCHHGCRFCSAGFIYRPPRFYPDSSIINAINKATEFTDKIGLISATVSDHPCINSICSSVSSRAVDDRKFFDSNIKISFSSLRLDALTDETIETLVKSSVKTATIAPEAGSQRMRNIINKKINEEQILSAVKRLVEHGIMNLKLYYMVGLPFEEDADVKHIVTLTEKIKDVFLQASRKNGKIGNITLSINPFIPKPSTPFQWCAMDTIANFKRKVGIIKDGLKRISNITINTESPKTAIINAMLSRGDRRMADMLEKPEMFLKAAKKIKDKNMGNRGISENGDIQNIIYNPIVLDAPLPWDILDTGIKKEFLIKELKRAEAEKTSPDCPMVDCSRCSICMEL
ncbi:MAG: radical SAM protein [Desulfamplus sp.]|nr:radical SAM protein [Desulfamplus sp.]